MVTTARYNREDLGLMFYPLRGTKAKEEYNGYVHKPLITSCGKI